MDMDDDDAYISDRFRRLFRDPDPEPDLFTNLQRDFYHLDPLHILDLFEKSIHEYLGQTVIPLLEDNEHFVSELLSVWQKVKAAAATAMATATASSPSLQNIAPRLFKQEVYDRYYARIRDTILSQIELHREGHDIHMIEITGLVRLVQDMGLGSMRTYVLHLEALMISAREKYYLAKGSQWSSELTCLPYMLKIEECLKKEKEWVKKAHYLHQSSETKYLKVISRALDSYILGQFKKEFASLLDKEEDFVKILAMFIKRPQGLISVASVFKQHIIGEGKALVKQAEDAKSNKHFVEGMIELHTKYAVCPLECLRHRSYQLAAFDGFKELSAIVVVGSSFSELVATYIDEVLKQNYEKDHIEEFSTKAISLTKFCGEDPTIIFGRQLRSKLSRRLLSPGGASALCLENEMIILTKLRLQHSSDLTFDMEVMVRDLTLFNDSKETLKNYRRECRSDVALTVKILNSNSWPLLKDFNPSLPAEMDTCVNEFRKYYEKMTNRRKFWFLFKLGSCHLIGNFDSKDVHLHVSTPLALVLLLFNESRTLSCEDIVARLNWDEDFAVLILHKLSCANHRILLKVPDNNTVGTKDIFKFNSEFTATRKNIKIFGFHQKPPESNIQAGGDHREKIDDLITPLEVMKIDPPSNAESEMDNDVHVIFDEDEASSFATSSLKKPKLSKPFELKEWNAVALWSWDTVDRKCWICHRDIMDICSICIEEAYRKKESWAEISKDCTVVWGKCNHAFHLHCHNGMKDKYKYCVADFMELKADHEFVIATHGL